MEKEKYYYLRKINETSDRALYKHSWLSRFYRSSYPVPHEKSFRLYKVKRLSTILRKREHLHDYCNEWFDVYDQDNNKVELTHQHEDKGNNDEN